MQTNVRLSHVAVLCGPLDYPSAAAPAKGAIGALHTHDHNEDAAAGEATVTGRRQ
jgi:hypothetical protein